MYSWLKYLLCLVLQLSGFVTFLFGFFPQKNVLPGFNTFHEGQSPFAMNNEAPFDKLIFIVVDALRSDFMFSNSSLMHFLHSLVRDGSALPYTAFAHPPTVTLPRLKGITTGGTPSFIDAVLNVADDNDNSQGLSNVDSWLYQFRKTKSDGKIHFFGDDTWLKLFPGEEFFEKYEGTDSFFVSDFTEVDNNVTRHLNSEILDHSWDALILHYLGLDHIGHKSGPKSVYMKAKQEEMDSVLRSLYESRVQNSNSTLLLLMGDHGMNNLGNHGGSSKGETSPGVILASPMFREISESRVCPRKYDPNFEYYSKIFQIDLVPTLSALFNFPIPKNNLGIIIPDVLKLWPLWSRSSVLLENCRQFMALIRKQSSISQSELLTIEMKFKRLCELKTDDIVPFYTFLRESQSLLSNNSTNYRYTEIWLGYFLILMCILGSCYLVLFTLRKFPALHVASFIIFTASYSVHFHGSSLIEEEHQIWWLLTISILTLQFVTGASTKVQFLIQLCSVRLIRSWNNSGQKFSTISTVANLLLANKDVFWFLVLLTYADFARRNSLATRESKCGHRSNLLGRLITVIWQIWFLVLSMLSFWFKCLQFLIDGNTLPPWLNVVLLMTNVNMTSGATTEKKFYQNLSVLLSQYFFLASFCYILCVLLWSKKQSESCTSVFSQTLSLILVHQTRIENIPIFLVFEILKSHLPVGLEASSQTLYLLSNLCIQHLSFFSMGNTNLLATVDLSNAYNGVSEYNIIIVSVLTFVSNFASVLYWLFHQIAMISFTNSKWRVFYDSSLLKILFYLISMGSLVGSCINLRYHLFIWSVFSPKLLYFSVWSIWVNFIVELVFGCLALVIL